MYSANKLTGKVELLLAQEEWISLFSRGSFQRSIRSNFWKFFFVMNMEPLSFRSPSRGVFNARVMMNKLAMR